MTKTKLSEFKGNRLTPEEKEYRLKKLKQEIAKGLIDEEFIPFLNRINALPAFMTTQCCTGHGEIGRTAHIDFRCSLPPEDVINWLLRPIESSLGIGVTLMLEESRCRYVLWLDNASWKEQMEKIIETLEKTQNKVNVIHHTAYQDSWGYTI